MYRDWENLSSVLGKDILQQGVKIGESLTMY